MPIENQLSLFVPLLFLVILKLSDIAREVNLKEIQGNPPWDILIWSQWGWSATLPNLGRFNFIHAANFYFAGYALFMVQPMIEDGKIQAIFSISIITVWILLPIFEVDEYDSIPPGADGEWPKSFRHHYTFTFLTALAILVPYRVDNILPPLLPYLPVALTYFLALVKFALFILLSTHAIEGFLKRLDNELSTAGEQLETAESGQD